MNANQINEIHFQAARTRLEFTLSTLQESLSTHGPEKIGQERWDNLMAIAIDGLMMCRENRHMQDEIAMLRKQVSRFLEEETRRITNQISDE